MSDDDTNPLNDSTGVGPDDKNKEKDSKAAKEEQEEERKNEKKTAKHLLWWEFLKEHHPTIASACKCCGLYDAAKVLIEKMKSK